MKPNVEPEKKVVPEQTLLEEIEETKRMKRSEGTRKGYRQSVTKLLGWMENHENYKTMITDQKLNKTFRAEALLAFCQTKKKKVFSLFFLFFSCLFSLSFFFFSILFFHVDFSCFFFFYFLSRQKMEVQQPVLIQR